MLLTFFLVVIGWIIFRAESISDAWGYICRLFGNNLLSVPWLMTRQFYIPLACSLILMVVVEWINRGREFGLDLYGIKAKWMRIMIYYVFIVIIYYFQPAETVEFIYFQF